MPDHEGDTLPRVALVLYIRCVPCGDDRHELCAESITLDVLWSAAFECGCVCQRLGGE
jgi:hypothetical protein